MLLLNDPAQPPTPKRSSLKDSYFSPVPLAAAWLVTLLGAACHPGVTPGCMAGSDLFHMSHLGGLLKSQRLLGHVLVMTIKRVPKARPRMHTEGSAQVLSANTPSLP